MDLSLAASRDVPSVSKVKLAGCSSPTSEPGMPMLTDAPSSASRKRSSKEDEGGSRSQPAKMLEPAADCGSLRAAADDDASGDHGCIGAEVEGLPAC